MALGMILKQELLKDLRSSKVLSKNLAKQTVTFGYFMRSSRPKTMAVLMDTGLKNLTASLMRMAGMAMMTKKMKETHKTLNQFYQSYAESVSKFVKSEIILEICIFFNNLLNNPAFLELSL